jgi:hypothetical protein
MAVPVAADVVVAGNVALATPIGAPPSPPPPEPEGESEQSFLEMTATGRDLSSGAKAAVPREVKAAIPLKLLMAVGGAVALLTLLGLAVCIWSVFFTNGSKKSSGTLTITKAEVQAQKFVPGQRTFVNVFIERSNFRGPIKITLLDLPPNVSGETKTISEGTDKTWVGITANYEAKPGRTPIRVHVEGVLEEISADFTLPLVIVAGPTMKKK